MTEDQIKETVENPQIKYPHKVKGRWVHQRPYGNRILKIVVAPTNSDVLIITAYWL
ncbi:MAG: DUF4258 domain-containing protein [Chloroflexi bacterium]|nr:DUF4258 domain-containing protein [Chloroflexota bacterium]